MKNVIKKYELGRIEIAFIIIILLAAIIAGLYAWKTGRNKQNSISSFEECVAAGNPVMEKYPEECMANGQTFTNPDQVESEELANVEPNTHDSKEQALIAYCNDSKLEDEEISEDRLMSVIADGNITIEKDGYLRTKMSCLEGGEQQFVFMNKVEDKWQVLATSATEAIDCELLFGTKIPAEIAKTCTNEKGEVQNIE